MSILFVFILNLIFISFVRVQSDPLPGVVCSCMGTHVAIPHTQNVEPADVPDRCKVVIIGEDFFNEDPSKEDATAIAAMKAAGKIVYMIYESTSKDWPEVISDPKKLDPFIQPMLAFLKNNKIEGVILGYLSIHAGVIPDYATKINTLISKIKQSLPPIKIGLYVDGADCDSFKDTSLFDFTVTNPTLDFYVVDTWSLGVLCEPNLNAKGGRQPIKSSDPKTISLEKFVKATTNSAMDKSKLVVYVSDFPTLMHSPSLKSYSDFCTRTDSGLWCADTSQILYDKVAFLKNDFKGLMINYLELDDMTDVCGCGQFPVANTYMDAWEGKGMSKCGAFH